MRLSAQKRDEIREDILRDFFTHSETKLVKKQTSLVKQNHMIWLEQYKEIIHKLPHGMLNKENFIYMNVINPVTDRTTRWSCHMDNEIYACTEKDGYYDRVIVTPIQNELKIEVAKLAKEYFDFKSEKSELTSFLNTTLEKNNTTTKLRKVWPKILYKYIPDEPIRTAKKPKQQDLIDTPIPLDAIKQRLTKNLLEK